MLLIFIYSIDFYKFLQQIFSSYYYFTILFYTQTAQFDESARFKGKGGGSLSIPPPAPGYAATPAQIAAMQGRQVMTEKKKNDFFVGSKGGFTFW